MRLKRILVILLVFFLIAYLEISYADETCEESQIILKLSAKTNAHGELWNQKNYLASVCYNEIFGVNYQGANPHSCNGANKVVRLSAETNAHAEKSESNTEGYIDVCYGNLACTPRLACASNEKSVVTLPDNKNTHLALDEYHVKICCSSLALPKIGNAFWTNMKDEPVVLADLNDRVKLVASGENFEGKEITFTIYKERLFWFDKKVSAQTSSVGWTTWAANKSGEYYFEAVVQGETTKATSDNLEVSSTENNKQPYVKILAPRLGEIYYINENVNFAQESYDEDDFFNYTWSLDGEKKQGNSENLENYNTTYSYTNSGQKNIFLEAIDERNLKNEDRTSILIVDYTGREYVFAHIDKPEFNEEIIGNKAKFNASRSYAIRHSEVTTMEVGASPFYCIAGDCPKTASKKEVKNTPNWEGFENLSFNWTFIEKDKKTYFIAKGNSGALFEKEFSIPAKPEEPHKALLIIYFENTTSRERETQFSMKFDRPVCDWEGTDKSYWSYNYETTDSKDDCYKENGIPKKCCPVELSECNINTGKCEEGAIECKQYSTPKECENFNPAVPEAELNPRLREKNRECGDDIQYGTCREKTSCICYWNEKCVADSSHTICKGNNCYDYENSSVDFNRLCESEKPPVIGDCLWDFKTRNECNTTGKMYRAFNVVWTGKNENKPDYCEGGEDSMPCISQALLGFFDNLSLVIAIIIIIIFYIIVIKKKAKYKRKKRK